MALNSYKIRILEQLFQQSKSETKHFNRFWKSNLLHIRLNAYLKQRATYQPTTQQHPMSYLPPLSTVRPRPGTLRYLIGPQFQLGHDLLQVQQKLIVLSRFEQILLGHAFNNVGRGGVQTVELKTDRLLFGHQPTLDRPVLVDRIHDQSMPKRGSFSGASSGRFWVDTSR